MTGETVVLLPDSSKDPLVVSGSAALLWDYLAAPATARALAVELAGPYEADPSVIEADIGPVLEQLSAAGALAEIS
ncbi:MAG: PqqD family peptide modification chaperone [Acidimicrobiales bacterium]